MRRSPLPVRASRLCCAIRVMALMVLANPVSGAALPAIDAPEQVSLPANGDPVRVPIGPAEAARIRLQLERAPVGVTLDAEADGSWSLRWDQPDPRFAVTLVLSAVSRLQPDDRQRIEIELIPEKDFVPVEPAAAPEPVASVAPDEAPSEGALQAPEFDPVVNAIVSAGRTARLSIVANLPDGQQAEVEIDRLPDGAALQPAKDGSYTFRWRTSERDQGEHRFRVTATNIEDLTLGSSVDFTVIVGDPSRGSSAPAK